jgi:hypothetical protein
MRVGLLFAFSAAASLIACGRDGRRDPEPASSPAALTAPSAFPAITPSVHASSATDVSGAWNWSSVQYLTAPPFVAQLIFGIQPEGPVTRLRCDTSGTLNLTQAGDTFTGTATQQATCETGGGYIFVSPPSATPPVVDVADGRIAGRSLKFVFSAGPLTCPFEGVITDLDQSIATDLRATGRCIIPGHPQSPVPAEPPPGGTSKTVSWTATRP